MQILKKDIKEKLIDRIEKAFSVPIQSLEKACKEAEDRLDEDDYEKPYRKYDDQEFAYEAQYAIGIYEDFFEELKTSLSTSSTSAEVFDDLIEFAKKRFQNFNEHDRERMLPYVEFEKFPSLWYEVAEFSSIEELQKMLQLS